MKPIKVKYKKFKKETKFPHLRSDGIAKKRYNGATKKLIKEQNAG